MVGSDLAFLGLYGLDSSMTLKDCLAALFKALFVRLRREDTLSRFVESPRASMRGGKASSNIAAYWWVPLSSQQTLNLVVGALGAIGTGEGW